MSNYYKVKLTLTKKLPSSSGVTMTTESCSFSSKWTCEDAAWGSSEKRTPPALAQPEEEERRKSSWRSAMYKYSHYMQHTWSSRLFPLSDVMESCWRALHNHSCACFAIMHPLGALKPWNCTHKHTSGTKISSPSDIYIFSFFFCKWPSDWANAHFAAWDKDTKHIPRVLKLSLPTG